MLSKDARPQDTIRHIRAILKKAGFNIEVCSWKHPVPYVWSVHVRVRECRRIFANGKGLSRDLALASALGELMERINTGYSWSDYSLLDFSPEQDFVFFPEEKWFCIDGKRLPSMILNKELRDFYDPTGELSAYDLVYRVSAGLREGICAIPFTRVSDGEKIYFPLNLLDNLYASNGMASGNTPAEARVQALSEILERYVKYKVIREGIALPLIPERCYICYPEVTEAIAALKQRGFTVTLKDASLGGRYPVVNIVLGERNSKRCFLSFGAHPSFETALTRTLTELLQGQDLGRFRGLQEPCSRLSEAAEHSNLEMHFIDSSGLVHKRCLNKKADFKFYYVNCRGTRKAELEYLLSIFKKARRDVYIADFPESGFYACRVLVPGMSEVYSVDDLVFANNNRGAEICRQILRLPAAGKKELEYFLRELDSKYIGDNQFIPYVSGIAFDKGSPWEEMCFGELRMLVQLALGRTQDAAKQLRWCFESGNLSPEVEQLYKCLAFVLEDKLPGRDIPRIFAAGIISKAVQLARGRRVFARLFDKRGRPSGVGAQRKITASFLLARKMRERKL